MKPLCVLLSFTLLQPCFAQFKVTKLDKNSIPKNIHPDGNIFQAVRWTDNTGDNVVILTATDKT